MIRKDENEAGRFRVILCEGAHPQFEVVVGQIKDQLPMRVLNDAIGSGKAAVGEYLAVVYNGGGQIVGVFAPGELTETLDSTLGLIRQIAGTQGVGEDVSWEVFGPGEAQQSVAKKVSEFSARPDAGKRIYSLLELAARRTGTDIEVSRIRVMRRGAGSTGITAAIKVAARRALAGNPLADGSLGYSARSQDDGSLQIEMRDGGLIVAPAKSWGLIPPGDNSTFGRLTEMVDSACREVVTEIRTSGAAEPSDVMVYLADRSLASLWMLDHIRRSLPMNTTLFDEWIGRDDGNVLLMAVFRGARVQVWGMPLDSMGSPEFTKGILESIENPAAARFVSLQTNPAEIAATEAIWARIVAQTPAGT